MSNPLQRETAREAEATAKESVRDPTMIAAVASIGLSWYYFFIKGDRDMGLFVGLWAPTFLTLANYSSMAKVQNQIRSLTNPGKNIRESVQKMIGQ
jgi:hypothetical protein